MTTRKVTADPTLGFILIVALISMLGPFSIDTYLPAMPEMGRSLGASAAAIQLTMSVYLLGIALFPLMLSPLSDAIGRKPVLNAALLVYVFLSAACAIAPNVETMIVLRFLQAAAGGTVMTTSRALLADLYRGDALSRAMSYMMMFFTMAPIVAPLLGGWILTFGGWRWIFVALALIAVFCIVLSRRLPETLVPERRRPLRLRVVLEGYMQIMRSVLSMRYLICTMWSSFYFFALLTSSPFIFIEHFGLTPGEFSLVFALIAATSIIGNSLNMRLVMRRGYRRLLRDISLFVLALSVVTMIVALTGFGGAVGFVVVLILSYGSFQVVSANTTAGIMDVMGHQAGAASAVMSLFRFAGGAIGSAIVASFGSVAPWTFGIILIIAGVGMAASLLIGRQA